MKKCKSVIIDTIISYVITCLVDIPDKHFHPWLFSWQRHHLLDSLLSCWLFSCQSLNCHTPHSCHNQKVITLISLNQFKNTYIIVVFGFFPGLEECGIIFDRTIVTSWKTHLTLLWLQDNSFSEFTLIMIIIIATYKCLVKYTVGIPKADTLSIKGNLEFFSHCDFFAKNRRKPETIKMHTGCFTSLVFFRVPLFSANFCSIFPQSDSY